MDGYSFGYPENKRSSDHQQGASNGISAFDHLGLRISLRLLFMEHALRAERA